MTEAHRVRELWRYPVKSLQGERLEAADVDEHGLVGDRAWAVVTEAGKIGSGKDTRRFARVDGLAELVAATPGGGRVPVVRRGEVAAEAGSPDADALVTEVVRQPVRLHRETEVPHKDDSPLHLLTTSSLAWLASRLPGSDVDVRRFRPNLVVDTGDEPRLVEQGWIGRRLRIGELVVVVTHATERCRMTTMAQPGLDHDADVLRELAQANDADLGVYARVLRAATVRVGDEVVDEGEA